MLGGGAGAFIGPVHRLAAAIASRLELVGGVFSSDPERSREAGRTLGLAAERVHGDLDALVAAESALPPDERVELVAIVTPNHLHYDAAVRALEAGFHVVCDKPPTLSLGQARDLAGRVARTGRTYALTYTYLGYPLVQEARARVAAGALGPIRRVVVEYLQGWLSRPEELGGNAQAAWRTDPARAGISGCFADIGVHAQSLVRFITGEPIVEVAAELVTHVPGRRLDDDGAALFRLAGGGRGTVTASQVCVGEANGLSIRVYGERGSLTWRQENPNELWFGWPDRPTERVIAGMASLSDAARRYTRTPPGHPEGYLEAFANIYADTAARIRDPHAPAPPGIELGVASMAFLEAVVASSGAGGRWTEVAG
ncbi:oxidoreductase [Sphingomonas lenta]|uniref:Oxidoreductase n=2 Tax=Sphingomonas lenta TaxID=1141887 RepID=A0A2A2SES0_9SPHN|nr:oxidoreductase [Sphingomonas lenta]